jgi:hypothetical protein
MDVNITTNGTVNILGDWNWEDVASGRSNVFIPASPDITIGGKWWIAQSQGSKCTLNITGNPTITVGTDMPTAGPNRINCNFTMNMSNGSLDVAGRFAWESGGGALNVSGGTIECDTLVYRGEGGKPWTLNLSGGRITVIDEFKLTDQDPGDANAFVYLDGGTLECGSFRHEGRRYAMDINDGVFIIDGNRVAAMNEDVNLGYITAFDGTLDVLVTYDADVNKTTVRADYLQPEASDPSPEDYAQNQCPGVELSWTPGPYAVDHNVYFGPSPNDVDGSKDPCLVRYADANWVPPDLELGKTYYWRVDEINDACAASPWPGDPWHFTTEDGNARDPDPPISKRYHNPSENTLTWTPSCAATSQNVYFSTDFNDVNELKGTYYALGAADNNISPTLERNATYYWRVKTIGGGDGKIWNFTTGFGVIMHYTFDGSQGASLPSTVPDDSGSGIEFTKHVGAGGSLKYGESNPVYNSVGTSAEFNPSSGLYRLDTGGGDPLRLDGPQYTIEMWLRPDVLSGSDMRLIGKNQSWRIILEDPGGDNRYAWVHGGNSEDMGDDTAVEGEWAHLAFVYNYYDPDEDRMKMYLDGLLKNDNDEDTLNSPDNNNPVAIGFRVPLDGNVANGTQYFEGLIDELRILDVALTPTKFLLTPGPEWASNPHPGNRERDVDPNDPSLALTWNPGTKVDQHKVYFSTNFEDVNSGSPAALMATLPAESNSWPADANLGNYLLSGTWHYWRIDEVNTGVSGSPWEGVVWKFVTKYEVKDPHLRVWYPLDEDSGDEALDTSGFGKHGDVDIDDDLPSPNWEPQGGQFAGCLVFDNDTAIEPPQNTLPSLADNGITVAMWLNGLTTQNPEKNMWVLDGGTDDHRLTVQVPNIDQEVIWRAGNDSNDYLVWGVDTSSWQGDWHHLAFVKDESAEKMYIYLDGDLGWWKPGTDPTITNLANEQLRIGARETSSNNYEGKIDDFRIYDIALSETSIEELVRGGDLASAWGPSPYDGQADAPRDANLVWNAGDYADSHDVYFGTDYAAVRDANTSVTYGVFRGNQAGTVNDIDILDLDTWYFWRIDEVNDSNGFKWKGNVWKFKVADYITIDDFESYESTSHLNQSWIMWTGGGGGLLTGARPYLANYSVLYPAHGGDQIMRYGYSTDKLNPPGGYMDVDYAEAYLSFTGIRRDWTDAGVRALTLYFYGLPTNDANGTEQMYVGVEDTAETYAEIRYGDYEQVAEEDMNDLKEPEWHRWFIALPDFNDSNYAEVAANVDFSDVDRFYIGFGNRRSPSPGGSGEVRFDDIRLNLPVCRPEITKPVADFSGPRGVPDCVVDLADIGYIAENEWLKSDANFADIIQEPCDANLLGHWKLDSDPCDSSSYNHYGYIDGDSNNYSWVTGHDGEVSNPAIEFTGTCRLFVPDDNNTPALRPKYHVSVSAWAYSKGQSDSARVVVKGQDNKETYLMQLNDDDKFMCEVRDANGEQYDASTGVSQNEWLHLAGTYDGNVLKCYVNAELRETTDANFVVVKGWTLSQDKSGLAIGNRSEDTTKQFNGIIDDVRVYDYALSQGEVAWLATDGEGYVALTSPANLYDLEPPGEKAVNLRDIALLIAEHWLDEAMWP